MGGAEGGEELCDSGKFFHIILRMVRKLTQSLYCFTAPPFLIKGTKNLNPKDSVLEIEKV